MSAKPYTLHYHGESITIDANDLGWVTDNLRAKHDEFMLANKSWQTCRYCESVVFTAANVPCCELCDFILSNNYEALAEVARLVKNARYTTKSAAYAIAQQRQETQ